MTRPTPSLADIAMEHGVRDERVLQAMKDVSRRLFVPSPHAAEAESDIPIPIGHGQVTTQPSLVAAMVEAVAPELDEIVLEVGTGHGYQAALLSRLARFVWSIERWPDLAETARANLVRAGIANAAVVTGDGSVGLAQHAPYDAIVISAAFPTVPSALIEQLRPDGRLVQPVGTGGHEEVNLYLNAGGDLRLVRLVTYARFVPLVRGEPRDHP